MSKFLDNLKHLVVEEDPNATQPEPTPVAQPKHQQTAAGIPGLAGIPGFSSAPPTQQTTTSILPSSTQGTADANLTATFVGKLREKFATSAFAGLLTQFTSTLEALTEDTPEEGKRFRMAIKVTKLTPDQLVEAYNSLLSVLDQEAGKFKARVDQQTVAEVDARDQQAKQIDSQIEGLNKQIEALAQQRDGILTDKVAAKSKLAAASVSFEGAVNSLQAEVNDSLQKLRIYLPATATAAKK
jgi:archaellum component FlaC